jgi:hypothetical protein
MNPESNGVKTWQWVVTVLVIIILIVLGYYMFRGNDAGAPSTTNTSSSPSSSAVGELNRVVVTDQFPGNIVYVSSVQLGEPGFVVVQKDNEGKPGAVIGSQYFDKGINPGKITLTESTKENSVYYAVVYADTNGNKIFDVNTDQPLKDASGNIIMKVFRATSTVTESKG